MPMRHGISPVFLLILIAVVCVSAQEHPAQGPDALRMGPTVRASVSGESIVQLWAYADPKDGRHLIACGAFSYPQANVVYGYVYSSSDAGATWRRTLLEDGTSFVSEENCTYGQDGRAYFTGGESDMSTGQARHEFGHLQVFISRDHGMTWKPAGRREWVDWTVLATLPAHKRHAESLAIFGNNAADTIGHWSERRPVVVEATFGAQEFSSLMAPTALSYRNFSGGSAVLPDRTALFVSGATDPKTTHPAQHQFLNVYAYDTARRTVEIRATLRDIRDRFIGLGALLAGPDVGSGFHGRLYAAWSESAFPGSEEQLWLATSDDKGYHWASRAVVSTPDYQTPPGCPTDIFAVGSDIRIALNRSGTLGLLWKLDAGTVLFTASTDGGRTFPPARLVARQPMGELLLHNLGGVPFDEHWLAESIGVRHGESPIKFVDLAHIGLSVRLDKPRGIQDFVLVADARGIFHALWTAIQADGTYALMTRTIDVPKAPAATTTAELTQSVVTSVCGEDTAHLQAPAAAPVPPLEISGQTDISESLNLQVDHVDYDAHSHIVTASVSLMNKTARVLRGPLSLFGVGLHSDFGVAAPLNADATLQGQPMWDLAAAIPPDGLPPNAKSKPIQLRFKIDRFHPAPTGNAVAMHFQVFAKNAVQ